MLAEKTYTTAAKAGIASKVKDYAAFVKFRLSFTVVLSAFITYLLAADTISWPVLTLLITGGFLITAASNGLNQVIEVDLDKLMKRTADRPLVSGNISSLEAIIVAALCGVAGFILLWMINPLCGILGVLALFMYVVLYTPLKRITPFAVFVGAIPGAIPPMLGWIAYTGKFGVEPGILFAIQFMWQFSHFWALAWVIDEDYKKAGFRLLPSGNRDKQSAFQIMLYSMFLLPTVALPYLFGMAGMVSLIATSILTLGYVVLSVKMFRECSIKAAKKLMIASFFYIPVIFILYVIDKI